MQTSDPGTPPPPPPTYTPHPDGVWNTVPASMPINPIHAALMPDGTVVTLQGSGNCPPTQAGCPTTPAQYTAAVLDPIKQTITTIPTTSWDIFCNGAAHLPDGRLFVAGGTQSYAGGTVAAMMRAMGHSQPERAPGAATNTSERMPGHKVAMNASAVADDQFLGSPNATIYDPSTTAFTDTDLPMVDGRWYPTVVELNDGRMMVFGGQDQNALDNNTVEFYSAANGWDFNDPYFATNPALNGTVDNGFYPQLYPRMFLLPNGKVFYAGPDVQSYMFDPANPTVWNEVAKTNYTGIRTYGSAVLLPLVPPTYKPTVVTFGGNDPATNTVETIDLSQPNPAWVYSKSNMKLGRIEMQAVLLPNGKVLTMAGSANDEDPATASLDAEIYDPATDSFSPAGTQAYARLYHNTALLLPDGSVVSMGSNPAQGQFDNHIEVYQPPYFWNPDGSPASRPTITTAPTVLHYGQSFQIATPNANIKTVVLMKLGADTHSFDTDQRYVGVTFTSGSGSLTATAPPNGSIAPPGYYMLFLVNSSGIPSVASILQVEN
jgi:galactose oxidase